MTDKCNRTACNNTGLYKHKDNEKLYCLHCAIAINECSGYTLFDLKDVKSVPGLESKAPKGSIDPNPALTLAIDAIHKAGKAMHSAGLNLSPTTDLLEGKDREWVKGIARKLWEAEGELSEALHKIEGTNNG